MSELAAFKVMAGPNYSIHCRHNDIFQDYIKWIELVLHTMISDQMCVLDERRDGKRIYFIKKRFIMVYAQFIPLQSSPNLA